MKKVTLGYMTAVLFLLCACGDHEINYQYGSVDVSEKNQEAQQLYDEQEYEESLEIFLDAMQEEPKDIQARIGVIKCQIALENYDIALSDLSTAIEIAPRNTELYDLYFEISQLTEDINVARTAVDLAKRYDVNEIIEKMPQEPVFSYAGGHYDSRLEVSVSVSEPEQTEIYITVDKEGGSRYSGLLYTKPWVVTSGETHISAYCVKDGIPSEVAEETYICEYQPTAVQFQDEIMEQLVRNIIEKPEGDITDVDCEQVTNLSSYDLYTDSISYEEYSAMQIHTLSDLQFFPNLTSLMLQQQTEIEDYSPIAVCSCLDSLGIYNANVSDIGFIRELPMLHYLYIEDDQITDISPVSACKKITTLRLAGNPVDDISVITELEDLDDLSFDTEQIEDIGILAELNELRYLSVECNGKDDLSLIGELSGLESLTIQYDYWGDDYNERSYITDISYLENLTSLTYLSISGLEDLSNTDSLKKLVNLQNLYLYNRGNSQPGEDAKIIKELQRALPMCNISY